MASTDNGTRIRVTRRICADPTSTALLLAGPTAVDLWPGVRRVGDAGGALLVEADLQGPWTSEQVPPTAATVRALPPKRTPTAYVSRFTFAGPGLPHTDAVLTLAYVGSLDGTPVTHAALVLETEDDEDARIDRAGLAAMAERFLHNLRRAAEARSAAA